MTQETELKIRSYIQKYADAHGMSYEDAAKDAICKITALYYGEDKMYEDDRDDISR